MAVSHLRNTPITGKSYTTPVDATPPKHPLKLWRVNRGGQASVPRCSCTSIKVPVSKGLAVSSPSLPNPSNVQSITNAHDSAENSEPGGLVAGNNSSSDTVAPLNPFAQPIPNPYAQPWAATPFQSVAQGGPGPNVSVGAAVEHNDPGAWKRYLATQEATQEATQTPPISTDTNPFAQPWAASGDYTRSMLPNSYPDSSGNLPLPISSVGAAVQHNDPRALSQFAAAQATTTYVPVPSASGASVRPSAQANLPRQQQRGPEGPAR